MALSSVSYIGDGSNKIFSVTFPYLAKSHVKVYVNSVEVTLFTWLSASSISITTAPILSSTVLIKRTTPTVPLVDFVDGSTLTESLLDTSSLQGLYVVEEGKDTSDNAILLDVIDNKYNANSKVIKNLAAPVDGTDAVNKTYVDSTIPVSVAAAASSASASEASAIAAAASYDSFDDRYLGVKAANPTLDNDGNALLTGALYFNSVSTEMRVYSGSSWVAAYVPASTYALKGANSDITSLISLASINGGQLAGFRNKIINGNMGIYQRGTSAVTISTNYGPADRWQSVSVGNTFSTTQGSFVSGDTLFDSGGAQYFTQVAVTSVAGIGNYSLLIQRIEDVRLLAGQTVTVSFWAKAAAGTPSVGLELSQGFGTGGSALVTGIGQAQALTSTWTKYTKTFTVPSISGKTIGTEATHSTNLNFWLDAGSDFNTRTGSIGQSSKTVSIAQVQLEIGSIATPFEFRPYGTELALCQRYYYNAPQPIGVGSGTTSVGRASCLHPVPMRATPTINCPTGITFFNGTGTITSTGTITGYATNVLWQADVTVAGNVNGYCCVAFGNQTSMTVSAEL